MKTIEKNVKVIFCEKIGKNKTLEENCAKNYGEIKFEFTSPGTLHKYGMAEQGFATLYYRIRTIMANAGPHENLKTDLWPECAATTTKLKNIIVNPHEEKCA